MVLRAHVRVGHRTMKSSFRLRVGDAEASGVQPIWVRLSAWTRSLWQSQVQAWIWYTLDDYKAGQYRLVLRNHGRGFARSMPVYMVLESANGTESLVQGAPIYRSRMLRPGGEMTIRVPLDLGISPSDQNGIFGGSCGLAAALAVA